MTRNRGRGGRRISRCFIGRTIKLRDARNDLRARPFHGKLRNDLRLAFIEQLEIVFGQRSNDFPGFVANDHGNQYEVHFRLKSDRGVLRSDFDGVRIGSVRIGRGAHGRGGGLRACERSQNCKNAELSRAHLA